MIEGVFEPPLPPEPGDTISTGQKVCGFPKCGVPIAKQATGRPAKFCDAHRNQRRRNQLLRSMAGQGDPDAIKALEVGATDQQIQATQVSKAQRLAVGLSATKDPDDAAELVGLTDLEPEELRDLAAAANAEHPDLVNGRVAGLASLSSQAIALLFIRVRDTALHLPPAQAASALKQAADVAERLLGGVAPSFATVTVELNLGKPNPE